MKKGLSNTIVIVSIILIIVFAGIFFVADRVLVRKALIQKLEKRRLELVELEKNIQTRYFEEVSIEKNEFDKFMEQYEHELKEINKKLAKLASKTAAAQNQQEEKT